MPAFQNLYISSINGGTLRSTRQSKSLEVAPHIKAVSFHFQTSVYGIKCNITKNNCAVDLKERHKLCELVIRAEASCAEAHPSLIIIRTKPRKGTSAQNHEKSKFSSRKL